MCLIFDHMSRFWSCVSFLIMCLVFDRVDRLWSCEWAPFIVESDDSMAGIFIIQCGMGVRQQRTIVIRSWVHWSHDWIGLLMVVKKVTICLKQPLMSQQSYCIFFQIIDYMILLGSRVEFPLIQYHRYLCQFLPSLFFMRWFVSYQFIIYIICACTSQLAPSNPLYRLWSQKESSWSLNSASWSNHEEKFHNSYAVRILIRSVLRS